MGRQGRADQFLEVAKVSARKGRLWIRQPAACWHRPRRIDSRSKAAMARTGQRFESPPGDQPRAAPMLGKILKIPPGAGGGGPWHLGFGGFLWGGGSARGRESAKAMAGFSRQPQKSDPWAVLALNLASSDSEFTSEARAIWSPRSLACAFCGGPGFHRENAPRRFHGRRVAAAKWLV